MKELNLKEVHPDQTVSVWMATSLVPQFPALAESLHTEICIVGGGIAGLSIAYALAREGKSVVVLEGAQIGAGMTEHTTAHLTNAIDDRYYEIARHHSEDKARLAADSHTAAIDRIESIATLERMECEFERLPGYLFAPPGENPGVLDKELEAAHRAGLGVVESLQQVPGLSFPFGKCLRFPRQAQFHPLKYLSGLCAAIMRHGGQIFCDTHVSAIENQAQPIVKTQMGHSVSAEALVVATNAPINNLLAIHTKQAPYTTYVIGARVPRGAVPRALYWDTADPYHYVRVESIYAEGDGHYDILIIGGEDHKTGQAQDGPARHAKLEAWARERFPMIESIDFRWSGQVMEPHDGLAFIGRNPGDDNIYIATGDSGMGMTHGTIAGMLITDLIMARANPWAALYDPSRKSLHAPLEFAKENANVAAQYAEDYLSGGDVDSVDDIAFGEGAVMRRGLKKVAVYRDSQGELHEYSAACPHLGCVVAWNTVEKSWDCPCHGSRFDHEGKVITGPAISGLAKPET